MNRVIYSYSLLFGFAGIFLCAPFPGLWQIRIRPDRKLDKALLAHEKEHLRQYRAEPWIFFWGMVLSRRYRHAREQEAYAVELYHTNPAHKVARAKEFATILTDQYGGTWDENFQYLLENKRL